MAEKEKKSAKGRNAHSASARQARIDKITSAALSLLLEKGYHETSIQDIAKAVGNSKGILYHYFKSKEEIFTLVSERATSEATKLMLETSSWDRPFEEELKEQIRRWYAITDRVRPLIIFAYGEFRYLPREAREKILNRETEVTPAVLKDTLDKAVAEGLSRDVNTEVVALILYALGHIWALGQWFLRDAISLEDYSNLVADIILNGIKKR